MKKYLFSLISAVFMLFVVTTSAQAATYYVAKTGSNSNPCTPNDQTKARLTVTAGVACLSAGDTLIIKAGAYNESPNSAFMPTASSWATATTIKANPGDTVIFGPAYPFRTFNSAAAYVIFDGLIFDGASGGSPSWSDGISIGQGAGPFRFINVEVKNFGANGINTGTDGNEFINCKVHNGGTTDFDNAIYVLAANNLIDHCEIYNWAGASVQIYNSGVYTLNNNIVRFNRIHDTSGGIAGTSNTNTGGFTNGFRSQGIILQNGNNNQAYGNIIYNLRNSSSPRYAILAGQNATNSKIYNNTIYNNPTEGIEIYLTNGVEVKNNILYNNTIANVLDESSSGQIYANNLCNVSGIGCAVVGNPNFVNLSANDVHLTVGSITAIDRGVTLGTPYNIDFDGITRPQGSAYDIGAYEFVSGGGDTTPPSTPTLNVPTAISSSQINLSWTASTDPTVAGQVTSGVTGYRVERCTGSTCTTFTQIATPTGTTYNDTGLTANTTYRYRVRAVDAAGNLSTYSSIVNGTTPATSPTITIGETNILTNPDSGNGNKLLSQQATLSQTATIQSLSFYVTTASGDLRLGIYDATGPSGGPGAKKAETNQITPVVGWNTENVITPVSLSPGTYWLAYFPSSDSLAFRVDTSSGTLKWYALTYGTLPPTFGTTVNTENGHWSFYATLNTPDTTAPSTPTLNVPTVISSSQINLSWSAASDSESAITSYRLYYCSGASSCIPSTLITLGNVTNYSHTSLTANTLYRYQVSAVSSGGEGGRSAIQSATTQAVALSGPIAWYKFDEGTGTTAADSAGTNTGTLLNGATACANTSGCPTWSPTGGRIGGALSLDGIDDAVRVTGLLGNSPNITLAGWANLTSSDVSGSEVISLGDAVAIRLQSNTTDASGFYYDGTAWNSTTYPFTASGTGWHHIAYVVNDTTNTQTLYIDGTARTTTNYTPSISYTLGANTFVGRHGNGNSNFDFKGLLDDVRVYNRALTATEVQSVYNEASATTISSLTLTPSLEGRSSPLPQGIAFTITFLTPGTNTIITSMSLTTNASGQLVPTASQLVSLPQGTYDIRTASQYYLSRKMFNQVLTSTNTLTAPTLYAGDFNNDSTVNNFDWSIMATNWFTSLATTDINKDSITNSVDYSYINRNWNRVGE